MPELGFDSAYRIEGYDGIAWGLRGYAKEWTEEWYEDVGTQSMPDYIVHEPEEIEDRTRVEAVMIGDDRVFTFGIDEITPIDEDEYCPECGQIGCTAYG
jgi:hypothetical protein